MTLSQNEQDPTALKELDTYLSRGLFQYYLEIDAEKFEGYANHADNDIKFYDEKMNVVYTLDKPNIRTVYYNNNDVLSITTVKGSIRMER